MTLAAPAPPMSRRLDGPRLQGVLALLSLVAAVLVTVVLVVSPASSTADGGARVVPDALPDGVRVEVRGGEAWAAYGVADRLTGAGASLTAVVPAASRDAVDEATTIVYYDRRQLPTARRIRTMLGRGTLHRQQAFRPAMDVTIVLGKDLARL